MNLTDLEIIHDFIQNRSPGKAKKIIESILSRTLQLERFPQSGSPLELKLDFEYRYLVEGDYKIIYSLREETVYVETVFNTRQNPDNLKLR